MKRSHSKAAWLVSTAGYFCLLLVTLASSLSGCAGDGSGACVVGVSCTTGVSAFSCDLENGDFYGGKSCSQVGH